MYPPALLSLFYIVGYAIFFSKNLIQLLDNDDVIPRRVIFLQL